MIQVLIADNHRLYREGLKKMLEGVKDISVKGESGSGEETLRKIGRHEYDVIVLDICLPDMDGLELLRQILEVRPQSRVLILSCSGADHHAIQAFRLGACGYLSSSGSSEEFLGAIRKIAGGGKYVSAPAAEELIAQLSAFSDPLPHQKLSPREYQVFVRLAAGLPIGQIAGELGISSSSVSTLRSRLLQKMGMKTNADIIRYGLEYKINGTHN